MDRRGRPSRVLFALLAVELAIAVALAGYGSSRCARSRSSRPSGRILVAGLALADLALWSDASYCRHPSEAGFFTAHADHPSAMDHFPAGSVVPPPGTGPDDRGGSR